MDSVSTSAPGHGQEPSTYDARVTSALASIREAVEESTTILKQVCLMISLGFYLALLLMICNKKAQGIWRYSFP